MKKFFLLLALLLCTSEAWAACGGTCHAKTAGGNWSAAGTWSATSSAGVDSVGPPAATDDVILDAGSGNVNIDSSTSVGKSLTCTGYTGTLTHTGTLLTISGNIVLVSGMTYTPSSTATLKFGASGSLTTGGKLIPLLDGGSGVTITLQDNVTFMAAKTIMVTLGVSSQAILDLNGKTISGNSSTNRVLFRSYSLGSTSQITVNGGTFANADFRDIRFSSASNVDLSAITGNSGDCGGNSITGGGSTLTFTTAATQTYTGGTGSWSDVTKWTSRVPLPQDNVSMAGVTGGTITADMPRLGKSIDWTGASGSPTWAMNSIDTIQYGSLTLISSMTLTTSGARSNDIESNSRSGTQTLTSAGKSFASNVRFSGIGATLSLQDAFTCTGTFGIINSSGGGVSNCSLITNGNNLTLRNFNTGGGAGLNTYNIANSTITVSTNNGTTTPFGVATTDTVTATGSTIYFLDTTANAKTFAGGGKTFNDLKIAGGGAGAVIITGANTFNRIYTDGGGTKSITLPGSTTTTIISGDGLGNGTNVITFTASSGSATVAKSGGGRVGWDYVSLTNIPASTANTWYAGPSTHSTDGGGNTNWIFSDAPNDSILMFSYPFSSRRFNSNR